MPFPVGAAIIAQTGGGLLNSLGQANQNRENTELARWMYEKQKADALEFWKLQNEYNSPQAQMKRFQEAGLNPNLIYGQGNTASPISTPDFQAPPRRSPEWGNALSTAGLSTLQQIYNLDIQQAQLDNLRAQNTVIQEDAALRRAQTFATRTSGERSKFGLEFESELRGVSADARREQLRQLRNSTDVLLRRDEREAIANSSTVREAAQRIINLQDQLLSNAMSRAHTSADISRVMAERRRLDESVQSLKKSNVLQDLDVELRKQGINPNDPLWSRIVGRILAPITSDDGFQNTSGNIFEGGWKYIMDAFKSVPNEAFLEL